MPIACSRSELYHLRARQGWRSFVTSVELYRYLEYPTVVAKLCPEPGMRVLDVGGGVSQLSLFLAGRGCFVCVADLNEKALRKQGERWVGLSKRESDTRGNLTLTCGDGARDGFADQVFDRVVSVSVLEHVPGQGDSMVVREMVRLLRAGGILVLTVPFGSQYREIVPPGTSAADCRVYDVLALDERLVRPSGLKVCDMTFWVFRGFDFEYAVWYRIPRIVRKSLGWTGISLLCSKWFFTEATRSDGSNTHGVCVTLEKPLD
jgi:SAM-dependent methyltransferase